MDERRIAPRHRTELKAQVSSYLLFDEADNADSEEEMVMVSGQTLDISESGLAVIVPAESIDERYLPGGGSTLQVVLELPTGTVAVEAMPVRYEVTEDETGRKYVIGARIIEMDEYEAELFRDYLRSIGSGETSEEETASAS